MRPISENCMARSTLHMWKKNLHENDFVERHTKVNRPRTMYQKQSLCSAHWTTKTTKTENQRRKNVKELNNINPGEFLSFYFNRVRKMKSHRNELLNIFVGTLQRSLLLVCTLQHCDGSVCGQRNLWTWFTALERVMCTTKSLYYKLRQRMWKRRKNLVTK